MVLEFFLSGTFTVYSQLVSYNYKVILKSILLVSQSTLCPCLFSLGPLQLIRTLLFMIFMGLFVEGVDIFSEYFVLLHGI